MGTRMRPFSHFRARTFTDKPQDLSGRTNLSTDKTCEPFLALSGCPDFVRRKIERPETAGFIGISEGCPDVRILSGAQKYEFGNLSGVSGHPLGGRTPDIPSVPDRGFVQKRRRRPAPKTPSEGSDALPDNRPLRQPRQSTLRN